MKKIMKILATIAGVLGIMVVSAMAAGPSGQAGKSNVAHLYLYEKNPDTWEIVEGGAWGKMKYNLSGPTFDFVFNGHGLSQNTSYSLIYYADPWPGNNPGAFLASGMSDALGDIHLAGSVNLGIDLPSPPDQNAGPCPSPGGVSPCPGAKIWLLLSSDYNASTKAVVGWNPTEYLFEFQGIIYYYTP